MVHLLDNNGQILTDSTGTILLTNDLPGGPIVYNQIINIRLGVSYFLARTFGGAIASNPIASTPISGAEAKTYILKLPLR